MLRQANPEFFHCMQAEVTRVQSNSWTILLQQRNTKYCHNCVWKNALSPYHVNPLLWGKRLCFGWSWPGAWAHLEYITFGCTWVTSHELWQQGVFPARGREKKKRKKWDWLKIIGLCSVHWKILGKQIDTLFLRSLTVSASFLRCHLSEAQRRICQNSLLWAALHSSSVQQVFMFFLSGWQQEFLIYSHLHQGRGCSFNLNGCLRWYHFLFVSFRDKAALNSLTNLGTCYTFTPFDTYCSPKILVFKGVQVSVYRVGGIYLTSKLSLVSKHPLL